MGFPQIERTDIEQLERFNGMESKKFETPLEREDLEVADEFIRIAAYVVSDLDSPEARLRQREQDEYFEEEGLSF